MMNKLLLTLLTTAAMVTASAADYQYLTFEMTDGTKASVEAANLSLIFDGTTLKVGKESFTLTNLTKMYFSTGDETTGIRAIGQSDNLQLDNSSEIYDLSGKKIVNSKSSNSKLPHGVYIVKTKNGTAKLTVR